MKSRVDVVIFERLIKDNDCWCLLLLNVLIREIHSMAATVV